VVKNPNIHNCGKEIPFSHPDLEFVPLMQQMKWGPATLMKGSDRTAPKSRSSWNQIQYIRMLSRLENVDILH